MKKDWSQKLPVKNLFSKSVFLLMVKLLTIDLNDKDPNTQVKALIWDQTEKKILFILKSLKVFLKVLSKSESYVQKPRGNGMSPEDTT